MKTNTWKNKLAGLCGSRIQSMDDMLILDNERYLITKNEQGDLCYGVNQRPLINNNTTNVLGGVLMDDTIIVVDDKIPNSVLDASYQQLCQNLNDLTNGSVLNLDEEEIISKVYFQVNDDIQYQKSTAEIENIRSTVLLDTVLLNKFGVCKHHALLTVYLINRLQQDGILKGVAKFKIGRQSKGAHAWATYTTTNGTEYVIDVSNRLICDTGVLKNQDKYEIINSEVLTQQCYKLRETLRDLNETYFSKF